MKMKMDKMLLFLISICFALMPSIAGAWSSDTSVNTPISLAADDQESPIAISDGSGGAIIAWKDYRNSGDRDIFAQRVDATGAVQWALDGVPICTAGGNQQLQSVVSDGARGGIFTWADSRNAGVSQIYLQRISGSGVVQWAADGILVEMSTGTHDSISDGSGGVIVVWEDSRSGNDVDVYAQHIDANGTIQWTAGGVAVSALPTRERLPSIAPDGTRRISITY